MSTNTSETNSPLTVTVKKTYRDFGKGTPGWNASVNVIVGENSVGHKSWPNVNGPAGHGIADYKELYNSIEGDSAEVPYKEVLGYMDENGKTRLISTLLDKTLNTGEIDNKTVSELVGNLIPQLQAERDSSQSPAHHAWHVYTGKLDACHAKLEEKGVSDAASVVQAEIQQAQANRPEVPEGERSYPGKRDRSDANGKRPRRTAVPTTIDAQNTAIPEGHSAGAAIPTGREVK